MNLSELSLSELQSAFSRSLCKTDSSINQYIVGDHFSADDRMQVYRNNFVISLSEVLAACYPITLQLVGEECFQSMAKHHIIHHPHNQAMSPTMGKASRTPYLNWTTLQARFPI